MFPCGRLCLFWPSLSAFPRPRPCPPRPDFRDTSSAAASVSEITVAAQKREEKIETVPVAVTAFSGKQRSLVGIQTVQDLTDWARPPVVHLGQRPPVHPRRRAQHRQPVHRLGRRHLLQRHLPRRERLDPAAEGRSVHREHRGRPRPAELAASAATATAAPSSTRRSVRPRRSTPRVARGVAANFGEEFGEAVVSGPITDNAVQFVSGSKQLHQHERRLLPYNPRQAC